MNRRSAVLAAAAAAIFVSGAATQAAASEDGHHGDEMVKCHGVNSCKGHSECATDTSSCNGKNECAGKGWIKMSPEECEKAKAARAKK
ncbi:MAG TPA: hypothetical protein ENI85_16495 [Deltaproteobacteria bacterium]|nr:hypothetical protein [Deltaproteobacteria bacterium]